MAALAEVLTLFGEHQERLRCFVEEWSSEQVQLLETLGGVRARPASVDEDSPAQREEGPAAPFPGVRAVSAEPPGDGELMKMEIGRGALGPGLCRLSDESQSLDPSEQTRQSPKSSPLAALPKAHTFLEHSMLSAKALRLHSLSGQENRQKKLTRRLRELGKMLDTEPPERTGCFAALINSSYFESLCSLVIAANAGFIWYTSDLVRANRDKTYSFVSDVDLAFCVFYACELGMRIGVHRQYYLLSRDWKWNMFDIMLVILAIQDQLVDRFLGASSGPSVSFIRVLRLLKTIRILRVIRIMRAFRELRLIMNSIMGSIGVMMWAGVLIATVTFMFGLCFVQGVTIHLQDHRGATSPDTMDGFDRCWGSVLQSMWCLYIASFGGENWEWMALNLREAGLEFMLLFMAYIVFFFCVMTNTITSLLVEGTINSASNDLQGIIVQELKNKDKYVSMLREWFNQADEDKSGCVSLEELRDCLDDPDMVAMVSAMGIQVMDLKQFFGMLSCSGQREVDLETFVVGCIKMRGEARSMDLQELIFEHRSFANFCHMQFKELHKLMDASNSTVRSTLLGSSPPSTKRYSRKGTSSVGSNGASPLPSKGNVQTASSCFKTAL
jgi:hypothetical protein